MGGMPRDSGPPPRPATGPARDLGDVWELLDTLPPAAARVDLAATTVDLVAAKVAARPRGRGPAGVGRWLMPVAAVAASLAGGFVAGRATAPDPDHWVLEQLPVIEHLDLLQEAGSLEFLEAVAERQRGNPELPRWLRAGGDPRSRREDAQEFDAALGQLEAEDATRRQERDVIQARRAAVAALPAVKQARIERNAETFRSLANIDRRELGAIATALADPANGRLRDAARAWHLILAAMNPVVRRTAIEMPVEERLEMLERPFGRPRDEFRERRPNNAPGAPERRPLPGGPPGFRLPPPPAAGPREAPAETRAPPR
jgi:hypothetical protein